MDEITAVAPPTLSPQAPAPQVRPASNLAAWFREGLRAAFLLKPRVTGSPTPVQLAAVLAFSILLQLALGWLEIAGPANFTLYGWLSPWWTLSALVLLVWALLWGLPRDAADGRPQGVAAWLALATMAGVPLVLLSDGLSAAEAHDVLASVSGPPFLDWAFYGLVWAWAIAYPLVLGRRFGMDIPRLVVLLAGLVALQWMLATYFPSRAWYPDIDEDDEPRLTLSQEAFEKQQAVWRQAVGALAPQRPGVTDVYGLVFAPYAGENVFLRESTMVADVLAQRFDAEGRMLRLVNHATTGETLPWATPLNLRRGIEALAQRMDRENDVLVLYLTSHGARNFKLSASHWPLAVEPVMPEELRRMLDEAGIRHRVVAISACYSGGWVGPLASDGTLVMTAADAEHTSYGCGSKSELTYFGRALFDEQLRATHSFEQAFAAAVPVIKEREEEARKPDGFSNPQISVGAGIKPVLDALAQRLDAAARP